MSAGPGEGDLDFRPSVAAGYWCQAEATEQDFRARLAGYAKPFLRTGGFGFLADGELCVTGRLKDRSILRGRNHYLQDFERAAERSHPGLRAGGAVAFAVEPGHGEWLVLVCEAESHAEVAGMADVIRQKVAEEHEVPVHEVVVIRAGTLPRTSSGKVRRLACRDLYLEGGLEAVSRSAWRESEGGVPAAPAGTGFLLAGLPDPSRALPLSWGQRSLWFLQRLAPDSTAWHLVALARVSAGGDPAALRHVFQALVDRHDALRTTFAAGPDGPVQRVQARAEVAFAVLDTTDKSPEERSRRARKEAFRPFDLENGPLFRVALLPGGDDTLLAVAIHHLVADLGSFAVIARDLRTLFSAEAGTARAPSGPGYADWIAAEERLLAGPEGEHLAAYWRRRLSGAPSLDLPLDRPRPALQGFRGTARITRLAADGIRELARVQRVTPFVTLLVAFQALLARYSGQQDFLIGSPASGRSKAFAEVVGYFANLLPLRADLSGDPAGSGAIARARATVLGALRHRSFPFARLSEAREGGEAGGPPLVQAMLAWEQAPEPEFQPLSAFALGEAGACLSLGSLEIESVPVEASSAQLDLTLMAAELDGQLVLSLRLDSDLFDGATAERMLGHLRNLLEALAAAPARPLRDLVMLSPQESRQLLVEWNATAAPWPLDVGLHELFEAQARRTPEATALLWCGGCWTYAKLARRAQAVAGRLRALGVGPEVKVVVFCGRTPDLVAALLGVLSAGGAYVPLDPTYPAHRISRLLADSGAAVALTQEALVGSLPSFLGEVVLLESVEEGRAPLDVARGWCHPDQLAYTIYTSGSTGTPNGVGIRHGAAVARVAWASAAYPAECLAGVLASTSACFDLSVFELFVPLATGGSVILAEDALELPRLADAAAVTLVNTVPSAMTELVRAGAVPASVRTVNLAGEPLRRELVAQIFERTAAGEVWNLYGPSEDTTYSTGARFGRGEALAESSPGIGRPLPNSRVHVLDPDLHPVPAGMPGQLWLGGAGLARGYLGQPVLTAERFRPDPFADLTGEGGARLYRTGDLVRRGAEGSLSFLGRLDHQVKVRGFRIELGEVESALLAHPDVGEVVVVARGEGDGTRYLTAYVAPAPGSVADAVALRAHLRQRLPEFMVPSAWVVLEALPRTPNGKVDRKALPAPELADPAAPAAVPRTPVEEAVATLFAELLSRRRLGLQDDFFALGGHSLLAVRLASRLRGLFGVDVPLAELFRGGSVATVAAAVERARRAGTAEDAPPLLPAPRDAVALPVSFTQERLWLLDRLAPGSAAYHIPFGLRLRGSLRVPALAGALTELVRRHEALRTAIGIADGRPIQSVRPAGSVPLPVVDLVALAGSEAWALRLAEGEARRPFALEAGEEILVRFLLLRIAPGDHLLVLVLHHAVADGASLEVVARELSLLYAALVAGRPSPLPSVPVQLADFAVWQRSWLNGEVLEGRLAYWRERLAGAPASLELPADRQRPPLPSFRGGVVKLDLPAELGPALRDFARREEATLFMVLLAGFSAWLRRYTGEEDLVVGSVVAGRDRLEIEDAVGCFVNTLALRTAVPGGAGLAGLLPPVREAALGAYDHRDLPFEKLVEDLQPERDPSRNPLFQTLLVLQRPQPRLTLPELDAAAVPLSTGSAKVDLMAVLEEGEQGGLTGALEYASDLFEPATAARMAGHMAILLGAAVAAPEQPVERLPLLSAGERAQILGEWSGAGSPASAAACLHDGVAVWAGLRPDAPALVCGPESLTYAELERRANQLAHYLIAHGLGPGGRAGVRMRASVDALIVILAILKAGGAYVPLDPSYPAERLDAMAADAGLALLVAGEEAPAGAGLPGGPWIRLAAEREAIARRSATPPPRRAAPDSLAYVLFTSGSTGRPKGVACHHAGAVSLLAALDRLQPLAPGAACALWTRLSFDVSVWEIFAAWSAGGVLEVVPEEVRSEGSAFIDWLAGRGIENAYVPPFFLSDLAERAERPAVPALRLRRLLVGVEPIPERLLGRIAAVLPGVRVVNGYGPTEATVCATLFPVAPGARGEGPVAIGRPVPGSRSYVVDELLELTPAGVPGELCIAGAGLAWGYWGRPELTAERFLPEPFSGESGARMYRTGDRVRWRPGGNLLFLGRTDQQVKVRGFRIEPGEVEQALRSHPAVTGAVVVAREDAAGERHLTAYTVPPVDSAILRAHLRERLPEFMVPTAWVGLEVLPLTPGGKVDRRRLPAPAPAGPSEADGGATAGGDPLAGLIAGILAELLGRPAGSLGAGDDFFDAGGHSLLAARAVARLREVLGVELPIAAVFRSPTAAALTAEVERARRKGAAEEPPPILAALRDRPLPVSYAQERLWFLNRLAPASAVFNIPVAVRLCGPLNAARLSAALSALVARHEALRTILATRDGHPVQVVAPAASVPLPEVDLAALPPALRETEAPRLAAREAARPFVLERGPLLRVALLRLAAGEHLFLLTVHHIVADGGSVGVLARDLSAFYAAAGGGRPLPLAPLPLQYGDFAAWQRSWLVGEVLEERLAPWRRRLAGAPTVLDLPADRPRPPVQAFRGTAVPVVLAADLSLQVQRLAAREGATPFMALLAAFAALLHRCTGAEDLVVGTAVAHRGRSALEGLVGLFANTLPLRLNFAGDIAGQSGPPTFRDLLARARETALAAYASPDVPFDRLVQEAQAERDLSRSPLFQVMLLFQDGAALRLRLPGVAATPVPVHSGTAKVDLTLSLAETPEGIAGELEVDAALFDRATAARLAGQFAALFAAAAEDPGLAALELPLLGAAESHQLLCEWNATAAPLPVATLDELFGAQADRTPAARALVHRGSELTYGELDRLAGVWAARLAAAGVGPGDRVGLSLERSPEMVAAMLGILRAGAAYVPLDPSYPQARLAAMLEDSGAAALVTSAALRTRLDRPGASRAVLLAGEAAPGTAPLPAGRSLPDGLAYLIYTSGSTGTPKGVAVSHRNAVNFLVAMDDLLAADGPGVWLAVTSISFDISVLELLWTLTRGFQVVLQDEARTAVRFNPVAAVPAGRRPLDLSLFYFAASGGSGDDKYRLLIEGAKLADREGFRAIWTPERHFHDFGGLYPNPSVTGAAVAAVTSRVEVRAGSVVLPLQDPLRVAEEWSVVDNLSRGRVAVSFASGWHADDFVLAPDRYADRKAVMLRDIETVRALWRGGTVRRRGGNGQEIEVAVQPRPVQPELPVWLTAAGNAETFRLAGEMGANVLTHLLEQDLDELAGKIAVYREARRQAGHDPVNGTVTLMLHTFVGHDPESVRRTVREPFLRYLRTSAGLLANLARSAGLRHQLEGLADSDLDALLAQAFERYAASRALFGTPEQCLATARRLQALGVDEIGCLIDFGIDFESVMAGLELLAQVRAAVAAEVPAAEADESVPAQILRHGVTHLQCTPAFADLLAAEPATLAALRPLRRLLLGGEALPAALAERLRPALGGTLHNLYGPTETTVWSLAHRVEADGPVPIGRPLRNTSAHLLDRRMMPVPAGAPGEVYLSGAGVAWGYHGRPDLTAERFLPDPFNDATGARLYRTGDLARRRPDGVLEFLGRTDHQVKVRGHRIEVGEIEAALRAHPGVREAAVVARLDTPAAGPRLVAYVAADGSGPLAPQRELPAGMPRFTLPNGLLVTYLSEIQANTGYRELFEDEVYLRHGIDLPSGATVLDVGANIGFFSLFVHQRCPSARVFAFEPMPPTFEALAANVALYGLDVRLFNRGMADRPGQAEFFFYRKAPGLSGRFAGTEEDRAEVRAIVEDWLDRVGGAAGPAPEEVEAVLDEHLRTETFTCELVTVSDVLREHGLERVDLLKVDAERSELDILHGIRSEDWEKIDQIVLEVHTRELLEEISALLAGHGFDLAVDDLAVVEEREGRPAVGVHLLYARSQRVRGRAATPPGAASAGELRRWLVERLPEPMVPADFVLLPALPRTANGKLDRRALPAPGSERPRIETPYVPPRTRIEEAVAAVWREILGRDQVGVHDNFFEVGGNSLLLVQLQSRLQEALQREVTMVQMFRHPTIHTLAGLVGDDQGGRRAEAEERGRLRAEVPAGGLIDRQKQFLAERKQRRSGPGRGRQS